jgi:hypothetical protein
LKHKKSYIEKDNSTLHLKNPFQQYPPGTHHGGN